MISVPGRSLKPSRAALPVSPEVAVRMQIFLLMPVFLTEAVMRCGSICRATSLNAHVGPCQSSRIYSLSLYALSCTSGIGFSPHFSSSYAACANSRSSASVKSVRYLDSTLAEIWKNCMFFISSISSADICGIVSGTNRPPSGAMPVMMASAAEYFLSYPLVLI